MQKYKQKTPIAELTDKLLRILLACGLGIAWFVYLWGLSLPAIAAGLAMGGLFWLCARLFGKKSTEKREKQMRRMIGGELALKHLLLLPPRHAAFQAAMWLSPIEPMQLQKAVHWGMLGTQAEKSVLLRLIAQHESMPINVQQVINVIKEARELHVKRCLFCVTAPLCKEAEAFAGSASPEIRLVKREELIRLAGLCSPATDEDLSALGRQKKAHHNAKEWLALVLDPLRARRYFWYGIGLTALALLTGQWVYPLPAMLCLALFALSKAREIRQEHGKTAFTKPSK
ncbi:MAG: hypothetical protein RSE58_09440 [Clostridia bacterium]